MSKIISSRHRWCLRCIEECFQVDSGSVENLLKEQHNYDLLTSVFKEHGAPKVFIFFQPPMLQVESGEWVVKTPGSPPEFIFTEGSTVPIRRRACYFLRVGPVNTDIACDDKLAYGEVGPDPLKSLELTLSKLYKPMCETRDMWGKAEPEHTSEFLEACGKITEDLQDSIKSFLGGLELRKPDKRFDVDARNFNQRSREDMDLVSHFEELLEDWCDLIEGYLDGRDDDDFNAGGAEAGPLTELEYWRQRMQRLTSVTEQLKTKECKTVISVLSSLTKSAVDQSRQKVFSLLRRWKQIDINITEAANEAKDNVKYLFTLEKFIEPLYEGTPDTVIDTLPALMNSIKMIHTIARYYNTTERMTALFSKITNQMIANCKQCIQSADADLWAQDPEKLVIHLESCLKLNEAYQENYRLTKDKLLTMPKGKQFDFSEQRIFGKFDLFCRRAIKLIDMFSTIHQFQSLAEHKLDGMEDLIEQFFRIVEAFQSKNHDLLDFHSKFDRDYVEFNVSISELETSLQQFINSSFESITSIENSLNLLKKFQTILQRDNLKSDLDSKFNIIFQNYGLELETVQHLYEKHKHNPPIPRDLPPVSGNIMWSRHLLKRIEEPMKKFESNQNVLSTKDAKRIIKTYNKVARTLVAFEYLWFQAWQQSIETAKAGLQATLIIRHPDDDQLYVNFDQEILQLIREAKCLDRMGIEIPESAKIVLLQEDKFKSYYNDLQYALKEYERVTKRVIPVAAKLLEPHMRDMEYKLRPGMITLTWTSMNIDAYKHHIHSGLAKLEELVSNINDIIDNRIEKNLKVVGRTILVDLPTDRSTQLNDFVALQERRISVQSRVLHGKNVEIENAVRDLTELAVTFPLDPHIQGVRQEEVGRLMQEYRHKMYTALLKCTKSSLGMIKQRIASRGSTTAGFLFIDRPFFEIFVNLQTPKVQITPDLEDVQHAINKSALAVLRCSKSLYEWGQEDVPTEQRATFFDSITSDLQIAVVCLLLTGSVQGLKMQVSNYLQRFYDYQWLWSDDKDRAYSKFMATKPSLTLYESKLLEFHEVDRRINAITSVHVIGALSINTSTLKNNLRYEVQTWKLTFSKFLHNQAKHDMNQLFVYIKYTEQRLKQGENIKKLIQNEAGSESSNEDVLLELSKIMDVLREIRERESGIEQEINPVLDMYAMLERFVGSQGLGDEENDKKEVLRHKWENLVDYAERVTDDLSELQENFKRKLLRDIKEFANDVTAFRNEFVTNGPMIPGIQPKNAVDRLAQFSAKYEIHERKYRLYRSGEDLFALRPMEYPELIRTKKELILLDQLYGLYTSVLDTVEDWKQMEWGRVRDDIEPMARRMESFANRCERMPLKLREWEAYKDLKTQIDDFNVVLPLLQRLALPAIMQRHWTEVSLKCGHELVVGHDLRLDTLLEANLVPVANDIEEICEGAERQLAIQSKLSEIVESWALREFDFVVWRGRDVPVFEAVGSIVEDLEEAQVQLQMMLTLRHISPFRNEAQAIVNELSDTSETLERWLKVQMLWCSLESVFTGGDIAKQLPQEAKKFQKTDKDFGRVMVKAAEQKNVVQCCLNDILKQNLIVFYNELEKCQKSLEGYLEQKRNKFPRFYFVSNPVLLQVLSQGSDPLAVQPYYEKIFDSVSRVVHATSPDSAYTSISAFVGRQGADEERVELRENVLCKGNIEVWLMELLGEQQRTIKNIAAQCAEKIFSRAGEVDQLRTFVDAFPGQFALLGIQLLWSAEVTEALTICKQKKTAVKECNTRIYAILNELQSWCLTDLKTAMNRTKIETLVATQLHHRDVTQEIAALHKAKQISGPSCFEWQRQCRFTWNPKGQDAVKKDGQLTVSITDVDFNYSYEYLSCRERLVVTPLTDRCYITLAQALGMCFGGAPTGPAGTGKTETVKDMGRSLGLFVVVQNCTDHMSFKDCGKIFKGLCKAGMWACFDDFNRVTQSVLSVAAQQVLTIHNAKKAQAKTFLFPGDDIPCVLNPECAVFITMNPAGYAGRQDLPKNLKALFRGVSMIGADQVVVIKVKLCALGYSKFVTLAKRFDQLYVMCTQQLSQQKHYDFGMRNILSVLRTLGASKRANLDTDEEVLLYRSLRDMNLPKLLAHDKPVFLSLVADFFPQTKAPAKIKYPKVEAAVRDVIEEAGLTYHEPWVTKIIQLYETFLVRHGIMLVGPTGGGKTEIFKVLAAALSKVEGVSYKQNRLNPKAIRSAEMYGEIDPVSGEWTTGVFSALWFKMNQRANRVRSWLICDGPVDSIWIEDLNTVLDDSRILTLPNGDRIPMTDQNKLMFEVGSLNNATPATVSRAGIIYVSDTELDWAPVALAWKRKQDVEHQEVLDLLFQKWFGECEPFNPGHMFAFLTSGGAGREVIQSSRVGQITGFVRLLAHMFANASLSETTVEMEMEIERLFVFSILWALGGNLNAEGRQVFDEHLRSIDPAPLPELETASYTAYDYVVELESLSWQLWTPDLWEYPTNDLNVDVSSMLVPTMDSTRASFLINSMHEQGHPVLIVGASGTAKTSTAMMYFASFDANEQLVHRVNFSSTTSMRGLQTTIENELDKRGGKNFGPPNGKKLTVFLDDMSMPEVNQWGDQPTLELVRQLVETNSFAFLDSDKRGDMKMCEDMQYVGTMGHPGGGANDIPDRLKRHLFSFNMIPPSITSINDIYAPMLAGKFTEEEFSPEALLVVSMLTRSTIDIWHFAQNRYMPTPNKFHYMFNMRDISRVFQGILLCSKRTILGGIEPANQEQQGESTNDAAVAASTAPAVATENDNVSMKDQAVTLVRLWKHECERVFCDKLVDLVDKADYLKYADSVLQTFSKNVADKVTESEHAHAAVHEHKTNKVLDSHGTVESRAAEALAEEQMEHMRRLSAAPFVNFMQEDVYDSDGQLVSTGDNIYEPVASPAVLKQRVNQLMEEQMLDEGGVPNDVGNNDDETGEAGLDTLDMDGENVEAFDSSDHSNTRAGRRNGPAKLVLFEDAMGHVLRICRIISMPRGSALLVGVGGNGKRSLAKLAVYMARSSLFRIARTKGYGLSDLHEDLRKLCRIAGQDRKSVTFLFTQEDIIDESFLDTLNTLLTTAEVPGLFTKEEMLMLTADLEQHAVLERPGFVPSASNLRQYFFDHVRENLHVVTCLSPMRTDFASRARKFPGIFNCCTIDWFLPWSRNALFDVALGYMAQYRPGGGEASIENRQDVFPKEKLASLMACIHEEVISMCLLYGQQTERRVYQTPKSFMCFVESFQRKYGDKLAQLDEKQQRVNLGLEKLIGGAEDVELLKGVLKEEDLKLKDATQETNTLIGELEINSLEAKKESDKVSIIQIKLEKDTTRIQAEKDACLEDLQQAQPYVDDAIKAIAGIKAQHLSEVKNLKNPGDIVKLVFDVVLILFNQPLIAVKTAKLVVKKQEVSFLEPSYIHAKRFMGPNLLSSLAEFGQDGKNLINQETAEFMIPYMELQNFTPVVAKTSSVAAEGLCTWVRAMKFYYEASKIVKPKMDALKLAESDLSVASSRLSAATNLLSKSKQRLSDLQVIFDERLRDKARIENGARTLQKKMEQAASLISGLSEERKRWTQDRERFAELKRCLIGDVAIAAAFLSYTGPFNRKMRDKLVNESFRNLATTCNIPVSTDLSPLRLLCDDSRTSSAINDWHVWGLPSDQMSVLNGVLVTQAERVPLLIDPQNQATTWLENMERARDRLPAFGIVKINSSKLRDQLEYAMSEGLTVVVVGVEQELNPLLDDVLSKTMVRKGKSTYIKLGGKLCAYHCAFRLFLVTQLSNPHFSPEIQARSTIVDFSVTYQGLEEQLLAQVIAKEQFALQDQLEQVIAEVSSNTKQLMEENDRLLFKLTSNSMCSLLDDEDLVEVLRKVKDTAENIAERLVVAQEARKSLDIKREQYRPVATRGCALYFSIVDTCKINSMYQTSLQQFMGLFIKSMDEEHSVKNNSVIKRVANIVDSLSHLMFRYVTRGLFETDKLAFTFTILIRTLLSSRELTQEDMTLFLHAGSNLDLEKTRRKPFPWLLDTTWTNLMALSNGSLFFHSLPDDISKGEQIWKTWYEDKAPELFPIPDYEERFEKHKVMGPWHKLMLVRAMRKDRTIAAVREFIRMSPSMGEKFIEPVNETIDVVESEMNWKTPVLYLLSVAEHTESIIALCARKKRTLEVVSVGQGQGVAIFKALDAAIRNGNWLLLQNAELGTDSMIELEEVLKSHYFTAEWEANNGVEEASNFRLFITATPHPNFPLGLLHMCTKVTNEPPCGIRANLRHAFNTIVDHDRVERLDSSTWRQLLFSICFLHSIVYERRKFGALGWNTLYDFDSNDALGCILFLERHMYTSTMSWPTVQFMCKDVLYGGKITDSMDIRLFATYVQRFISDGAMSSSFSFNPVNPLEPIPGDFNYIVPNRPEHSQYVNYIETLPEDDSPELFGLHPNADISYRSKVTETLLATLQNNQPRNLESTPELTNSLSMEETVEQHCIQTLNQIPEAFVMSDVRDLIEKQGGVSVPLNAVLLQEVDMLQKVMTMVFQELTALQAAIKGDIVMSGEMQSAMADINVMRVPNSWIWSMGGDEVSWMAPSVSKWMDSLTARHLMLSSWVSLGRPVSFWLGGFKHPVGFFTAMKQEVTRLHREEDGWALDDVVYQTSVTDFEKPELIKGGAKEGVFVRGLFLDGAAWQGKSVGTLVESQPKEMFAVMPILHVTGVNRKTEAENRANSTAAALYECPVYRYSQRTDRYLILMVQLASLVESSHWVLRSVALVCCTDA